MTDALRRAAEEALDALEACAFAGQSCSNGSSGRIDKAIDALRAALAEPQPVAWGVRDQNPECEGWVYIDDSRDQAYEHIKDAACTDDGGLAIAARTWVVRPLYAAPPAPQPQPVELVAHAAPSLPIVGTLLRHALSGDVKRVRAYGELLCDDMEKREPGSAKYLRRVLTGDLGETVRLAGAAVQPQPVAVQTAPERIWLQIGNDRDYLDEPFPNTLNAEVTWCADSVGDAEVEYVRADLVAPQPDAREAIRQALALISEAEKSYDWAEYARKVDAARDALAAAIGDTK